MNCSKLRRLVVPQINVQEENIMQKQIKRLTKRKGQVCAEIDFLNATSKETNYLRELYKSVAVYRSKISSRISKKAMHALVVDMRK
jgi:FixJ family two-component response regulator